MSCPVRERRGLSEWSTCWSPATDAHIVLGAIAGRW
ncbi:hypothetical protein [Arthrobacter sp. N199823]